VTRLRAGRPWDPSIPGRDKRVCLVQNHQTECKAHSSSCPIATEGSFRGGEAAEALKDVLELILQFKLFPKIIISEGYSFPKCDAIYCDRTLSEFRRKVLPPLSGNKKSILQVVGACSFDMFVTFYQTTRCYLSEDFHLRCLCIGNLRSNKTVPLSARRCYLKLGIVR